MSASEVLAQHVEALQQAVEAYVDADYNLGLVKIGVEEEIKDHDEAYALHVDQFSEDYPSVFKYKSALERDAAIAKLLRDHPFVWHTTVKEQKILLVEAENLKQQRYREYEVAKARFLQVVTDLLRHPQRPYTFEQADAMLDEFRATERVVTQAVANIF